MAYNKKTWSASSYITPSEMNNIDTGITECYQGIATNNALLTNNSTTKNASLSGNLASAIVAVKNSLANYVNKKVTVSTGSTWDTVDGLIAYLVTNGKSYQLPENIMFLIKCTTTDYKGAIAIGLETKALYVNALVRDPSDIYDSQTWHVASAWKKIG